MTEEHSFNEKLLELLGAEVPDLGLARITPLLKEPVAQIQAYSPRIITIAGTNGKGQTTRALAHLLKEQGISFAMWTSPHVYSVCERMVFNAKKIAACEFISRGEALLKKLQRLNIRLTYYEFLFSLFVSCLRDKKPRFILLEVGLGGRLDAVNLFDAQMVLIPSISRDHTEYLGNTYRQILLEKLGVCRPQASLLSAFSLNYLKSITQDFCQKLACQWVDVDLLLNEYSTKRAPPFMLRNFYLASHALIHLGVLEHTSLQRNMDYLARQNYGARGQRLYINEREIILWGTHNLDGLRKCVQFWQDTFYNESDGECLFDVALVGLSFRASWEVKAMTKLLRGAGKEGVIGEIFTCSFNHHRAYVWDEAHRPFLSLDWKTAIEGEKYKEKKLLVVGSFYFVAEVIHFCRSRYHFVDPECW